MAAPGFETMSEASVTCPASAGLVGEALIVHLEQQLKRTQLDGVRGRIIVRDVCHVDLRAAATCRLGLCSPHPRACPVLACRMYPAQGREGTEFLPESDMTS